MELALLGILGLIGMASAPAIPLVCRLSLAMLLSVPQIYVIPVGDAFLSLGLLSSYLLWPEMVKEFRNMAQQPAMLTLFALIGVQVLSWGWSPDIRLGFRTLIYTLPFIMFAAAAYSLGKSNPLLVDRLLSVFCLLMLAEVLLVVGFRLSPEMETEYLNSDAAGLLGGPNTIGGLLDGLARNNVLDPDKSGGVFVNGNVAAAYLGSGSAVAFFARRAIGFPPMKVVAFLLLAGVFFTGSKAGMLLAVFLPVVAGVTTHFHRYNRVSRLLIKAALIALIPLMLLGLSSIIEVLQNSSVFVFQTVSATEFRFLIWTYAAQVFLESPVLGQGFGGWQVGFQNYALGLGISANFPPHNTLIYLWSQSGLIAAGLAVVFMYLVMKLSFLLIRSGHLGSKNLGMMLLLVSGWIFIHGMGENPGLLGDARQQPLFAISFGLAYAVARKMSSARSVRLSAQIK